MVATTFHIAVAVLVCHLGTPDTHFQAGFAYNLIKTALTCTFWQVQMDTRMMSVTSEIN